MGTDHAEVEMVVLLDEANQPIGTMPKGDVHGAATPYHYAFSCYLFDRERESLLLTRRALSKVAWPGIWTNSCCGHPAPGESLVDAVIRRSADELNVRPHDVELRLPDFSYRAVDVTGVVEHEFCPVLVGVLDHDPDPNPAEVCDWTWVAWPAVVELAERAPALLSPWAVRQVPLLAKALEAVS